jgi:hypothetical protein
MSERLSAADRVGNPDAVLTRSDLRALGWERRAIDAIFRGCPVVALPGYSRVVVRAEDYRAYLAEHTYSGERVRPV